MAQHAACREVVQRCGRQHKGRREVLRSCEWHERVAVFCNHRHPAATYGSLRVNVAMKSLAEAALDTPGVCSSYLNETVKRGTAVADSLDRLMHAASGSPNVVSVIHRMTPALAQQQKYWGQDIAAMLNTCGIVPEKSRP